MCVYLCFSLSPLSTLHPVVALTPNSFSFYLTSVMHSQFYLTVLQRKQGCHSLFIRTIYTESLLHAKPLGIQQKTKRPLGLHNLQNWSLFKLNPKWNLEALFPSWGQEISLTLWWWWQKTGPRFTRPETHDNLGYCPANCHALPFPLWPQLASLSQWYWPRQETCSSQWDSAMWLM